VESGGRDRGVRHAPSLGGDPPGSGRNPCCSGSEVACRTTHHAHIREGPRVAIVPGGYDAVVTRSPVGWDVDSPVQAEVFVVWLDGDELALTGPDGPRPWLLQLGPTEHPVDVVDRIVRDTIGPPILVHSTSWRRDRNAVILSFVVVIEPRLGRTMASVPILRADLARSSATAAPTAIPTSAVVEHGLRHLAWLAQDDPVVAAELPRAWRPVLATYVPEPFRSLG
jgi:hypothetical protein